MVHMAVVVLWKVRDQGRVMQLPYELVEIILQSVVTPSKPLMSHTHADFDDASELGSESKDDPESEDQEEEDQHIEVNQDQEPDSDRGDGDED